MECAHRQSGPPCNSKRLILCCDGTWNSTNDKVGPASNASSLSSAFARLCCSGMPQIVYYHPGVGTEIFTIGKYLGGLLGWGVHQDIAESYRFICDNYRTGDEIFMIGFSRGAFTVRAVAEMVCALGFLNQAGLEQLPHIFHDYQHLSEWEEFGFNEKTHLLGFTLENLEKMEKLENGRKRIEEENILLSGGVNASDAQKKAWEKYNREPWAGDKVQMKTKMENEKKRLYKEIAINAPPQKDELYTKMLAKYGMCLVHQDGNPVKGKVKAVGVWDTVGCLGIPESPLCGGGAYFHPKEIQLRSLQIHPNIEYAFQALALDEWRTPFHPTMWQLQDNSRTKLHQVWFPGTHCNVGGGWPDQQIATIALAWMADQLSSLGVEFSKRKMKHIFYSVNPDVEVREWGMGLIHNPDDLTAKYDWVCTKLAWPYRKLKGKDTGNAIRTPGNYKDRNSNPLQGTEEFVHPCMRIRYLYSGMGLDDEGIWDCGALSRSGYNLVFALAITSDVHGWPFRLDEGQRTYNTVWSSVTSYHWDPPPQVQAVRVEQPCKRELMELPAAKHRWFWKNEQGKLLNEESIGTWELMFMKINAQLLLWQTLEKPRKFNRHYPWRTTVKVPQGYGKYGLHDIPLWKNGRE